MSAMFMLVVTSGPRLGDLESGLAAVARPSAGFAVVSGGLACVAAVGADRVGVPALAAYDGRAPAAAPGSTPSSPRRPLVEATQGV